VTEKKGTLIAVSDGGANKLFVGWTEQEQGEVELAMRGGDPIVLNDARILREITVPTQAGLAITIQVVPYSACQGGIRLTISPSHFFWPNEADARKILQLIEGCERDETKARASAAGISTPDGMRIGPGGRMSQ